ncbi:MAG: helix-turn-helix domain-containing protein [Pusillimonas sp.]|nr:helix-turn-helix domain-containing protein [Pusillimonas sp.]
MTRITEILAVTAKEWSIDMDTTIPPDQAARILGVSRSKIYALAAPAGPIPCIRIGRRVIFDMNDLMEYRALCRYTEKRQAVVSSLNSTAPLKAVGSGLENVFRKLGVKPKRTLSTEKNQPGCTVSRPALNVIGTQSKKRSSSTSKTKAA